MRLPILSPIAAAMVMAAPAVASAAVSHTIASGESLYSVAAADGLSVDQLAAANGLSSGAQLVAGRTLMIPPQGVGAAAGAGVAAGSPVDGDGDTDGDVADSAAAGSGAGSGGSFVVQPGDTLSGIASRAGLSASQLAADNGLSVNGVLPSGTALSLGGASAASAGAPSGAPASSTSGGGGSYVVQPGDTLSAIAARAGLSASQLAADNGLSMNGVLPSGTALSLGGASTAPAMAPAPTLAPPVGASIVGHMTWFGGPNDPGAQGAPASGLGWRSDGMSFYNYGSLGHRWQIHFPWNQTLDMTQIDIGPAPWTGNPFDIAFSALPSTPYGSWNWPNPVVTGTYLGQ
jgi:LysM repeat protein